MNISTKKTDYFYVVFVCVKKKTVGFHTSVIVNVVVQNQVVLWLRILYKIKKWKMINQLEDALIYGSKVQKANDYQLFGLVKLKLSLKNMWNIQNSHMQSIFKFKWKMVFNGLNKKIFHIIKMENIFNGKQKVFGLWNVNVNVNS